MDAALVIIKKDGDRKEFKLSGRLMNIGRSKDCELRIPIHDVSRKHAQVMVSGKNILLKDLGSTNGTFVNNVEITEHLLKAGDRIIVGPVVFTLVIDGKPESIKPVQSRLVRRPGGSARKTSTVPPPIKEDRSVADEILVGEDLDPISELEQLAASAEQTAIQPFDPEELG